VTAFKASEIDYEDEDEFEHDWERGTIRGVRATAAPSRAVAILTRPVDCFDNTAGESIRADREALLAIVP
jgi:hypothetical protein